MNIKQSAHLVMARSDQGYTGSAFCAARGGHQCEVWFLGRVKIRQATCPGYWFFPLSMRGTRKLISTMKIRTNLQVTQVAWWQDPESLDDLGLQHNHQHELSMGKRNTSLLWAAVTWGLCYSSLTWSLRNIRYPHPTCALSFYANMSFSVLISI